MNNATMKSNRLQRVRDYLEKDHLWHTTRDVSRAANVMAVSAIMSELRANGYVIDCEMRGIVGRKHFMYRMLNGTGGLK